MQLFVASDYPAQNADPKTFTGKATINRVDGVARDPDINVYRVLFQPSARTFWHTHTGPQILLIIEGTCYLQREGNSIQKLSAGDVARVDPDEHHWHGASPNGPMVHLAVNVNITTNWFKPVTDQQYTGRA